MTPAQIHDFFAAKPQATQIASQFACQGLDSWLKYANPRRVYEIGGGIGTLSTVILNRVAWDRTTVVVEEPNDFCRETWRKYVGELGFAGYAWLFDQWRGTDYTGTIDFLVVDGSHHGGAIHALEPRSFIFIEGNRRPQRDDIGYQLRERGLKFAWAPFNPVDMSKGYSVYIVTPTPREVLWFAGQRGENALLGTVQRLMGTPIGKKKK